MYFLDITPHPAVTLAKLWIFEIYITCMYVHIAQICVNKSLTSLLHASLSIGTVLELPQKNPGLLASRTEFCRTLGQRVFKPIKTVTVPENWNELDTYVCALALIYTYKIYTVPSNL